MERNVFRWGPLLAAQGALIHVSRSSRALVARRRPLVRPRVQRRAYLAGHRAVLVSGPGDEVQIFSKGTETESREGGAQIESRPDTDNATVEPPVESATEPEVKGTNHQQLLPTITKDAFLAGFLGTVAAEMAMIPLSRFLPGSQAMGPTSLTLAVLLPRILAPALSTGVFVSVYETLKAELLPKVPPELSAAAYMPSALSACLLSSFVRTAPPGYTARVGSNVCIDVCQPTFYDSLKVKAITQKGKKPMKETELALVGVLAGSLTAAVSNPWHVATTALLNSGVSPSAHRVATSLLKIAQTEGFGFLMKDVASRVMIRGTSCLFFFGVLELTFNQLKKNRERRIHV